MKKLTKRAIVAIAPAIATAIMLCSGFLAGCSANDPWNDAVYFKYLYVYDGANWNQITTNGGGALVEVDPVVGAVSGIVKANGAGAISAAVAGTDYAAASHATQHAVGGSDAVFPTDPNADKYLMWDDSATGLSWEGVTIPELYDAIVASSGGDYTSVATACSTEATGAAIFVRSGTYTEASSITMKSGQKLIGENMNDTIIDFNNQAYQINAAGSSTELYVSDFTISRSTFNGYALDISASTYSVVDRCKLTTPGSSIYSGIQVGDYSIVKYCIVSGFTGSTHYGIRLGYYSLALGNTVKTCYRCISATSYDRLVGNYIYSSQDYTVIAGGDTQVAGNFIYGNMPVYVNGDNVAIVGNDLNGSNGINNGSSEGCCITGNTFYSSKVYFGASVEHGVISGNTFYGGTGVQSVGKYCSITGNTLRDGAAITDSGTGNIIKDNSGVDVTLEKQASYMKNTSGGGLVAGNVVILKSVANGYEVTTTVTAGDNKVFGMAVESIANNAYGYIQTLGKTTLLKANGTDDIAIGDFLSTYTTAGIVRKAQAGDMAFAIALEAYSADDSNGVIDALLISPRKI